MTKNIRKRLEQLEKAANPDSVDELEMVKAAAARHEEYLRSPKVAAEYFLAMDGLPDIMKRALGNRAPNWNQETIREDKCKIASHLFGMFRRQLDGPSTNWPELIRAWGKGQCTDTDAEMEMMDPVFAGIFLELLSHGSETETARAFASFCAHEFLKRVPQDQPLNEVPMCDLRQFFLTHWFRWDHRKMFDRNGYFPYF